MNNTPLISIICPVYNVERYIEQSLQSVLDQRFADWECIVVDDGSTDGSGAICDEFARRDPRFRVYHQSNAGVGATRAAALSKVRGKYITFIDPDDWAEPDWLEYMYGLIESTGADVVQVGLFKEYTTGSHVKGFVKERTEMGKLEIMRALLRDKTLPSYMHVKMFRRSLAASGFNPIRTFEDIYAMSTWMAAAERCVADPKPLYHYRMRTSSIVHNSHADTDLDYIKACRFRAEKFAELFPAEFDAVTCGAYMLDKYVSMAKTIARKVPDKENRYRRVLQLSELACRESPQALEAVRKPKVRFRARLLRGNPRWFIRLMRMACAFDIHRGLRKSRMFP